jgi:hypothetical protein
MIPEEIIAALEAELRGLAFGMVRLEIFMHDKQPRYKITREISIVPGKPTSGAGPVDDNKTNAVTA